MIAKLSDGVLLEIFDSYRQSFEHQPSYERNWNNKNGWFKLAHVCYNWRCIVLASSSRLQLRIFFTDRTPTRAAPLTGLPPLPIIVDYLDATWTVGSQKHLASALRYPNRVCKVAMKITSSNCNMITKALDCAFPTLETLELHDTGAEGFRFPPTFLTTSTKSLRQLKLPGATLKSFPPLLSATTALVDLTLGIDTIFNLPRGVSLLAPLQHLSRLRHLDVSVETFHVPLTRAISPVKEDEVVSLPELTHFRFKGHTTHVEELLVGLATPSLQNLRVTLYGGSDAFHIPHLSVITRNMPIPFYAAQIKSTMGTHIISLLTHSHFLDDPPFNIFVLGPSAIAQVSSELSATLATVEDLFFAFFLPSNYPGSPSVNLAPLRGFFEQLHNVKILRVPHGLEMEVANVFRVDNGQPTTNHLSTVPDGTDLGATTSSDIPINLRRLNVGLFPALEEIEIHPKYPGSRIPESRRAYALEPFEELVTARQKAGRPVKVYWNTDQVLPTSFYDASDWW